MGGIGEKETKGCAMSRRIVSCKVIGKIIDGRGQGDGQRVGMDGVWGMENEWITAR